MLPGDALGLPAVSRTSPASAAATLGDPRQQALQRALAPFLGKSMQAEVLARLTDGSALVRVADVSARMPLPPALPAGAQLPLTLVALNPRPTFEVHTANEVLVTHADAGPEGMHFDGAAAPAADARGALARTVLAAPLAGAGPGGEQADLSPAGRLLGSVLASALRDEQQASVVRAPAPLLPAPGADPAGLAGALAHALSTSGLFYEAHVAEWAAGARTQAALAAEPQQAASLAGQPPDPLDPATASLINLQLATHEHDRVAWQGQLWPGQPLQVDIEKDPPQGDGAAPEQASWQSHLRLRFPVLGELDARLTLSGGRLQLRLTTDDAERAALLRAHQDRLAAALEGAGTPLAALSIAGHQDG